MTIRSLVGHRFGRLVVVERAGSNAAGARWLCRCDCGKTSIASRGGLVDGRSRSCGCLRGTHRMSRTPTYKSWQAMIQRCTNPNARGAENYSGRGIEVCDRWLNSFENFLEDMGERPRGMTCDRINNDGNYEPGNCRWATAAQQARNARYTRLTTDLVQEIHGRCEHGESMYSVAKRMGVGSATVLNIRRGRNWSDQMAGPT